MPFQKGNIPWIKGRKLSKDHKNKISESQKGYRPWRHVVAGWNKGIPRTEEQKRAHSEKMKGRKASVETKLKMSLAHKGITHTEEAKEKIRKQHLGRKFTDTHRKNISESHKGEKSYRWLGDDVGYDGIHAWVYLHKGKPDTCEDCKKSGLYGHNIHWHNLSGKYKRDLSDWIRLCARCHKKVHKHL